MVKTSASLLVKRQIIPGKLNIQKLAKTRRETLHELLSM